MCLQQSAHDQGSRYQIQDGQPVPVVQTIDVLVFLQRPRRRYVAHPDFLALIDERRARHEGKHSGQHLAGSGRVFRLCTGVAINRPRLVMILPVQRIPAVIVVHELLPGLKHEFQVGQFPRSPGKLVELAVVDVDVIELENHVDFIAIESDRFENFLHISRIGHFAHAEGVILFENLSEIL